MSTSSSPTSPSAWPARENAGREAAVLSPTPLPREDQDYVLRAPLPLRCPGSVGVRSLLLGGARLRSGQPSQAGSIPVASESAPGQSRGTEVMSYG